MKTEFTRKKKWQRLLVAVVLLLAFGTQAGAQENVQIVGNGPQTDRTDWLGEIKNGQTIKFNLPDDGPYYIPALWLQGHETEAIVAVNKDTEYTFNGYTSRYKVWFYIGNDDNVKGDDSKQRGKTIQIMPIRGTSYGDPAWKDDDKLFKGAYEQYSPMPIEYGGGAGEIYVGGPEYFQFSKSAPTDPWAWKPSTNTAGEHWAKNMTAMVKLQDKYYTINVKTGEQMESGKDFAFKFYFTPASEVKKH